MKKSVRSGAIGQTRPSKRHKIFTLEEAGRALPLVRRIVGDLVEQYRLLQRLEKERKLVGQLGHPEEKRATDARGHAAAARLAELIDEVTSIGCDIKDLEKGLVDFPAMHEGRRIELCWMLGEERVEWWHETTSGFAGRRRVEGTLV